MPNCHKEEDARGDGRPGGRRTPFPGGPRVECSAGAAWILEHTQQVSPGSEIRTQTGRGGEQAFSRVRGWPGLRPFCAPASSLGSSNQEREVIRRGARAHGQEGSRLTSRPLRKPSVRTVGRARSGDSCLSQKTVCSQETAPCISGVQVQDHKLGDRFVLFYCSGLEDGLSAPAHSTSAVLSSGPPGSSSTVRGQWHRQSPSFALNCVVIGAHQLPGGRTRVVS